MRGGIALFFRALSRKLPTKNVELFLDKYSNSKFSERSSKKKCATVTSVKQGT